MSRRPPSVARPYNDPGGTVYQRLFPYFLDCSAKVFALMEPIPKRSPESVSFEAVWRSLPRGGGIPSRDVFQPRLAKPFLPNLILLTVPRADDPTLRVRLVGDHI